MLFDSAIYAVFLVVVVLVYWRLRHHAQNRLLLLASYFFYGWWDWRFLILMIGSTTADYHIARAIAASSDRSRRRALLLFSLALNFGILGYFKYCNFFIDSFARVADLLGAHNLPHALWQIILPPAISFYTFQEVAYIVDVHAGRLPASRQFDEYALFISFFPHLIAGPIQRPGHLLPQVQQPRRFDGTQFYDGCMLILAGLFRKCVVADSCARIANVAFGGRLGDSGLAALLGIYAFAWQIYADFSGYSDIARGSAQVLGFHFSLNFRQPYLAFSLQDFWRRWHISLSTWLRDYVYIPLGGNRGGTVRTYRNLMTTMLLGGLWHGASWNFVIWGGLHGGGLAAERAVGEPAEPVRALWLRRLVIFHFVCFAWVFFRASTFHEATDYLAQLRHWTWTPVLGSVICYLALAIVPLLLIDLRLEHTGEEYALQSARFRWQLAAAAGAVLCIAFLSESTANAFIYFQF